MSLEVFIVVMISTKFLLWLFVFSFTNEALDLTPYLVLLTKIKNNLNFYFYYFTSSLNSLKRNVFLNFWSSGKFADTYWFIYAKSLNSRES